MGDRIDERDGKTLIRNTSNLIRERARLNRDLKITSIMQRPFKKGYKNQKQYGLFDKTSLNKTEKDIQKEEDRKLKRFRMDLANQLREKERIKFEQKIEDQRRQKRIDRKYEQQVEELRHDFEQQHDFEKPSVSRLRNPEAHIEYERRMKLFNQRNREKDINFKKFMKQETLFTDLMDSVMDGSLKTREELEKNQFRDEDILDRLMKDEREKEEDAIKKGMGFIVDNDLGEDFKRSKALMGDLEDVVGYSGVRENYDNLIELEKFQKKRKKLDLDDLTLSLDIGETVYFPPEGFGKVYSLHDGKKRKLIKKPIEFKKHLQMIGMRSSWAQSDSLLSY